jgi:hypothetical protein
MRVPMVFFAGAGTVLVAIAVGLSGGLIVANVLSPHAPKPQMNLLERRASDDAARALNTQLPVPYLAATTTAATMAAGAAPRMPPAEGTTAGDRDAQQGDTVAAKAAVPSAKQEPASAPEDASANAKAGEADLKRLSDSRRKAERRQPWTDRQQSADRRQWGDRQQGGDRQWSDHWRYRDRHEHDNEQDAWAGSSRNGRDKDRDHKVRDYKGRDHGDGDYRDRSDYASRRDDFEQPTRIFQSPRIGIFGPDD